MTEVVIFTRPTCSYCVKAKELLLAKCARDDLNHVNVFQIVLDDQNNYDEARAEMVSLANGKTSVPQVFVKGQFIPGGFTGLKQLDETGELDAMLKGDQAISDASSPRFDNRLGLKMQRLMKVQEMDF